MTKPPTVDRQKVIALIELEAALVRRQSEDALERGDLNQATAYFTIAHAITVAATELREVVPKGPDASATPNTPRKGTPPRTRHARGINVRRRKSVV
jgi:hypothetical protein